MNKSHKQFRQELNRHIKTRRKLQRWWLETNDKHLEWLFFWNHWK